MSAAAALLSELRRRHIRLSAVNGELRCSAPAGALTAELRAALHRQKRDLLALLSSAQALAAQARALVPLQAAGSGTPVFAAPGHNGDVFCFRALVRSLGAQRPFYGLQPPGLDGEAAPLTRIEALAAYFAGQIRGLRPQGPCIIAGYCAGGAVALELARQLQADGVQIEFVALFGSPFPSYFRWPTQLRLRVAHEAGRALKHARALVRQPWREYLARELAERRARLARRPASEAEVLARRAEVERATLAAVRRFRPRAFDGTLHLFHPSPEWLRSAAGAQRWRALARDGKEFFGPPGCTRPEMLRDAYAPLFAELLRRCY